MCWNESLCIDCCWASGCPVFPLFVFLPAAGCHIVQRTWETFLMPVLYFIFKNKQLERKIAKPSSMHRVSGFSAKPHFMLQALMMTRRSGCQAGCGARPPDRLLHMGPDWLSGTVGCAVASQVQSCCQGSSCLSARQAEWGNGLCTQHNRPWDSLCLPGWQGSSLLQPAEVPSFGEPASATGLLRTDLGSDPGYAVHWKPISWILLNLSVPWISPFITEVQGRSLLTEAMIILADCSSA